MGVYNLLSDAQVQVNAQLVWRSNVTCPVESDGRPVERCFAEAGTYFGALAVKVQSGEWLQVVGGSVVEGFASVRLHDGAQVQAGQTHRILSSGAARASAATASGEEQSADHAGCVHLLSSCLACRSTAAEGAAALAPEGRRPHARW